MTSATTGTGRRLSPTDRQRQLVAAGVEIVTTRPLEDLTADEVAAAAGVSKGLVFHYFPATRDLQAAVLRAAMEDLLTALGAGADLPPSEQLRAGIAAFIDYVDQQSGNYVTLSRSAGADPRFHEVFEEARERVTDLIETGIGLTESSPGFRTAIRGWIAMTEEIVLRWLETGDVGRDALVAYLHDALFALATPLAHLAPDVELPTPG